MQCNVSCGGTRSSQNNEAIPFPGQLATIGFDSVIRKPVAGRIELRTCRPDFEPEYSVGGRQKG